MQEFDRIFDCHDVRCPRRVDVVDHRGQGRALAAAGRAGDQHQPALLFGHRRQNRGELQFGNRVDRRRDDAGHQTDRAPLLEHVTTKAAQARNAVR